MTYQRRISSHVCSETLSKSIINRKLIYLFEFSYSNMESRLNIRRISPEKDSSNIQPRKVTSEYRLIFNDPYFLHLFEGVKRMEFVLSSPKWMLNLLCLNQLQMFEKFLFSCCSIILMSLYWKIRPVSSALSRRSQFIVCTILFT